MIAVFAVLLFAWRISGSMDLLAFAQDVPAMYVLDAVVNHHWLCQNDARGLIMSKPPLYTWLAGLALLVPGRATWFTLCLPSGLATLAATLTKGPAGVVLGAAGLAAA